ncbi:type IV secretion system protein VirB10 [Entomobacter blattae]|uniref:Protein virB10 n=1 Tax=Entomobacter blattae TaxID=2762277 RepID=A0A7H1NP57_9PROT|nr:type IV secretion system protein VirB10 [Entomobacter blattae]QNT77567.1 Protein virB10 [Entomobacter blattae]
MPKTIDTDTFYQSPSSSPSPEGSTRQNDEPIDSRLPLTPDRKKRAVGLKALFFLSGVSCLGFFGYLGYENWISSHENSQKNRPVPAPVPKHQFTLATTPRPEPKKQALTVLPPPDATHGITSNASPLAAQSGPKKHSPTPEELALQRRLESGFGGSIGSGPEAGGEKKPMPERRSEESSALSRRLSGDHRAPAPASIMAHPRFMVPKGTMITCGTLTELDTTVAGLVSCRVSRDVFSADGTVRLIDKGAVVDGEVSSGLSHGQERIFVLWTRLRNPDGVVVNLDSPGTNRLGSAGIEGQVDTHFFDRFGDAMMISLFSDLSQSTIGTLSNLTQKHNTANISTSNTQQQTSQMGNTVLQNTVNIPPTLYDQQGDVVSIYVARDLDFSSVYSLAYGSAP